MGDTYKVRIFALKRRLDEEIRLLDRNSTNRNRHNGAVRQLPAAPHHQRGADDGTVIDYNRCSRLYPRHQEEPGLLVDCCCHLLCNRLHTLL